MTPIRRLAVVFLVLLAGCHNFDYTSVHVDIGSIKLVDASGGGTDAVFTLNIMNETMFPIVIEEETHKVTLNGAFIGKGGDKESFGLPKMKITPREITIHIDNASTVASIRDAIAHGGTYQIDTRLVTNAGGDRDKMTTTSTGRLSLDSN